MAAHDRSTHLMIVNLNDFVAIPDLSDSEQPTAEFFERKLALTDIEPERLVLDSSLLQTFPDAQFSMLARPRPLQPVDAPQFQI